MVLSDFGIGTFWYFVVLTYFGSFLVFYVTFRFLSANSTIWYFIVLSGFGTGTFWYFMVLRENYTLAGKEMELSVTI